jgi:hypothetical protein
MDHQLHDLHKPPRAGTRSEMLFQLGPERGEARRKLTVSVYRSVIQCTRLVAQGWEVIDRFKDGQPRLHGPFVSRHDLAAGHDRDPIDIALDCHQLEGKRPWNAVPIVIEGDRLIFVHGSCGTDHARIKPMVR